MDQHSPHANNSRKGAQRPHMTVSSARESMHNAAQQVSSVVKKNVPKLRGKLDDLKQSVQRATARDARTSGPHNSSATRSHQSKSMQSRSSQSRSAQSRSSQSSRTYQSRSSQSTATRGSQKSTRTASSSFPKVSNATRTQRNTKTNRPTQSGLKNSQKTGPKKTSSQKTSSKNRAGQSWTRNNLPKKGPGNKFNRRKYWKYVRRRVLAGIAAVLVLAVAILCLVSIVRGFARIDANAKRADTMAIEKSAAPIVPKKSDVKSCSADDMKLSLIPSSNTTGVGGSIEFTEMATYTGTSPEGCVINVAPDELVLEIKSGDDVIWRSDACQALYDPRLLFDDKDGQKYENKVNWNTNRSSDQCVADEQLPHVSAGSYVAKLFLKDDHKTTSDPVMVTVE
ncbi:hypothetical protein D2E26_0126 [Bifidobacterium dolichotidis]|uniref:Peptide ABC transporter permease n=1 Tax=Bifidobacterium dolichotidis TaxID=2306976 RepID=A0A430FRU3_9BIFI|nr:hypothetical protein [Bifidobacterium dolichotidis]RSX55563.1 hypothetical protein D2E26_0126 [Bifidobacterium dolichotidis]